jgi:hypothetical protein
VSNVFISTGQYFVAWVPIQTPAVRLFESVHSNYTVATSYGSYSGNYAWDTNSTRINLVWRDGDKTLTRVLENQTGTWNWDTWDYNPFIADLQYTWILRDGGGYTIQKSATALDGGALTGPCRWQYGWDEVPDPVIVTGTGPLLNSAPFLTYVGFSYTNVPNLITRINSGNSFGSESMSLYAIDTAIGQLIPSYIDTSVRTAGTYNAYFSTVRYSNTVTTLPLLTINKAFEIAGVGTNYIQTIYGTSRTNRWFTWPPANTNQWDGLFNLFVYGYLTPDVYRGGISTNALYERYKVLQVLQETQEPLQSITTNIVCATTAKLRYSRMSNFPGYGDEFVEKNSVMTIMDYSDFMGIPPDGDFDFTKDWITGDNFDRSHTSTIQWDENIGCVQTTSIKFLTNTFSEVWADYYYITLQAQNLDPTFSTYSDAGYPYSPATDYSHGGTPDFDALYGLCNAKSPKVWRAGIPAAKGVEADFDFYFRYGTAAMSTYGYGTIPAYSTSACSRVFTTNSTAEKDTEYVPDHTPVDYPDFGIHFTFSSSSSTQTWDTGYRISLSKNWTGAYSTQTTFSASALKGPVVSKWKFQYCAP